jgi:hypothetical protein
VRLTCVCALLTRGVVFIKCAVSVTCRVNEDASIGWVLTRESGCAPLACYCRRQAGRVLVEPRGYIAVVFRGAVRGVGTVALSEVFFAKLCIQAVAVLRMVVPRVCTRGAEVWDGSVELFDSGIGSSGNGCECTAQEVCVGCYDVVCRERLFVCQTVFGGEFPFGRSHWFSGCSDAVGELEDGEPWLSWPCSAQRIKVLQLSPFV